MRSPFLFLQITQFNCQFHDAYLCYVWQSKQFFKFKFLFHKKKKNTEVGLMAPPCTALPVVTLMVVPFR